MKKNVVSFSKLKGLSLTGEVQQVPSNIAFSKEMLSSIKGGNASSNDYIIIVDVI